MRRLAVAILFLLAGCQTAPSRKASEPGDAAVAMADVQVVTSHGGITAWLVQEDYVPTIAVEMAWRGGSVSEPADRSGLGWLLAYMMNEGAGSFDTTAYGGRMEDLGMEFGCGVGADWTTCSFTTLKKTADESFEMLRLAFAEPRLDREPFERAKRELIAGLAAAEMDPKTLATRAMNDTVIPDHPYARHPTPASVEAATRKDIRAMMRRQLTRDELLVVVVGDITPAQVKVRLDEVFGSLPATSDLPAVEDATPRRAARAPVVRKLRQPQTLVMFSGPGIRRDDPDFYAAYLLNYILGGGGLSSRLSEDLREKRGLTYGVATGLSVQPHLWRWTGSSSTMNLTAGEVVRLIRDNIARLGREGPTEQELADAKAYVTGAFPLAFDSNAKIARNLMGFRQDGMDVNYVHDRNAFFNAVTLEDVKRVAAQYMKPEAFTFVLVGEPFID